MRLLASITLLFLGYSINETLSAQDFRLVRSLSGPSGRVDGAIFVFDEVRNRFVHPQDKSFIVFFEWDGPPGVHTLSGTWKQPDGSAASISPEVKISSSTRQLTCYWTYVIDPAVPPGVWTFEVRVDGQPSGTHSFEIAGTLQPVPQGPKAITVDDIFRATAPSVLLIRRFDASGKRVDSSLGFVVGKDRIATALQAIDGAAKLVVEFGDGRQAEALGISDVSRSGDWAVIAAPTQALRALERGDPNLVGVGERVLIFNLENGAKVIGRVDISGRKLVPEFGERFQFSPALPFEAVGGPLLDGKGGVIGVLGGSTIPGIRSDRQHLSAVASAGVNADILNSATSISLLPSQIRDQVSTLAEATAGGALNPPLREMEGLLFVGTYLNVGKKVTDPLPREVFEFSRRDKDAWVVSEWMKKGNVSKGLVSAKIYDQQNRVRYTADPKKTSLSTAPTRLSFGFTPDMLAPGIYRIDVLWDSSPVWRTFIRIAD